MTQPADSSKQSLGASCDQGNPIQGICNQGNPILGTGNQGNQFQCTGNQGNQFQGIGNQGNQIQGMGHQGNQSQAISNQGYSFPGNSNQGSLFQGQCNNGNSFQLASEPQGNINHGNQIQGSGNQGSPHHGHGNYASSFQVAPGSHGNSSPGNQSHGGGDLDHMAPGNGLQGNCYQGTIQIMPHAAMSQSGFEGMGTVLNIPSFQHRGLEAVGHWWKYCGPQLHKHIVSGTIVYVESLKKAFSCWNIRVKKEMYGVSVDICLRLNILTGGFIVCLSIFIVLGPGCRDIDVWRRISIYRQFK